MAKMFGSSAAPAVTANGSPGGIRPMPRPAGMGGIEVERAPQQQGGFLARQFGPQGSDTRYEMAMQLLQSAMSGAQGSNSPVMAFLAPLLGSAIGAKVSKQRDDYVGAQQQEMTEGLLGGPLSPQAQQALDVLNNPDAPSHLKTIAAAMFKQNAVPVGQMEKPARRSSGPGRLVGEYNINGVIHGRDRNGVLHPYKTADGQHAGQSPAARPATVTPAAAPAPALPAPPPDPVMPRDPVISADDDLINKYLD